MPFEYISDTCPKMNFSGFTCRNAQKPPWVVPSYTPVCKATWDVAHGDQPCIYGSGPIPNADCNCIGYFAQYCIDDVDGNRGRSWVVQYWCYNSDTGTATTTSVVVQDWECRCVGARYDYNLEVAGCCCDDCTPAECCASDSTLTLNISTFDGDCVSASQDVTLTKVDGECVWEGTSATPCTGTGTVCWRFELAGTDPDCEGTLSLFCGGTCTGTADATWSAAWHPAVFYPPTQWIYLNAQLTVVDCFDFASTTTLKIT